MRTRFLAIVRDYFGFSHKEARGFLALLILLVVILLAPWLYRWLMPQAPPDTSAAEQRRLDSLLAVMVQPAAPGPGSRTYPPGAEESGAESARPAVRFAFNPNTVSVADWQRLGLPRWLAERIERYRQKGGRFRKKEDLLRIYNFPPDLYAELEPYVRLEPTSQPVSGGGQERTVNGSEKPVFQAAHFERPARSALQPFDINTADTTQLVRLRGIGSRLAARIVKFRDALGGFISTDQYNEIFGLDSLAREELHRYAQIQTPARKIRINTASAEDLDRHPFLSRRQAEIIIRYREQHGAFRSAEDLKAIRILDEKTRERMGGYLSFE